MPRRVYGSIAEHLVCISRCTDATVITKSARCEVAIDDVECMNSGLDKSEVCSGLSRRRLIAECLSAEIS